MIIDINLVLSSMTNDFHFCHDWFIMIHFFSTKGGVDLAVRGGFLAYLAPNMYLLDRIYGLLEGEM